MTMRWPRPRFTVRWLMVAVAIAALVVGIDVMGNRRARYLAMAESYAAQEQVARANPGALQVTKMDRSGKVLLDLYPEKLAHYTLMRDRYTRAARYPWLSVRPDPE